MFSCLTALQKYGLRYASRKLLTGFEGISSGPGDSSLAVQIQSACLSVHWSKTLSWELGSHLVITDRNSPPVPLDAAPKSLGSCAAASLSMAGVVAVVASPRKLLEMWSCEPPLRLLNYKLHLIRCIVCECLFLTQEALLVQDTFAWTPMWVQ